MGRGAHQLMAAAAGDEGTNVEAALRPVVDADAGTTALQVALS